MSQKRGSIFGADHDMDQGNCTMKVAGSKLYLPKLSDEILWQCWEQTSE